MKATIGDHLVVHSHRTDTPDRDGEVLEVRGPAGDPPFLVRWNADGHVGLFFPGSDCSVVKPATPAQSRKPAKSTKSTKPAKSTKSAKAT